jgi:protein-S-isoprenylcysteine O-methyltransferase Ste14
MIWRYLIGGPWIVFCASWAAGALKTRRTVCHESLVSRSVFLFLEISGFVLLFTSLGDIGFLGHLVVPRTYTVAIMGVAFTWIGITLALWARWHLGQYWSGSVTLKKDHKLIRTGPYAHFRHPIYSGIDLAAVGGALAIDEWRCVVGVGLIVLGYWMKARKEESLLAAEFGEAFKEHCRHTGFLIPKFW